MRTKWRDRYLKSLAYVVDLFHSLLRPLRADGNGHLFRGERGLQLPQDLRLALVQQGVEQSKRLRHFSLRSAHMGG